MSHIDTCDGVVDVAVEDEDGCGDGPGTEHYNDDEGPKHHDIQVSI